MATNLNVTEIKAFIPSKNYGLSKQFYQDMGFTMKSDSDGVAYFNFQNSSFLLQDFYDSGLADNLMMHLLVENAFHWHRTLLENRLIEKYDVEISEPEERPWRMVDFTLTDPSGVLWRIAHNI